MIQGRENVRPDRWERRHVATRSHRHRVESRHRSFRAATSGTCDRIDDCVELNLGTETAVTFANCNHPSIEEGDFEAAPATYFGTFSDQ